MHPLQASAPFIRATLYSRLRVFFPRPELAMFLSTFLLIHIYPLECTTYNIISHVLQFDIVHPQ